MQTERVTFLTSRDHKAALDAYAKDSGMSVGHVLREAATRYIVEGEMNEEERFALLIQELDEALPKMHAALDRSIERLQSMRQEIDATMRAAGLWK
jgi:hypothetical protein